MSETFKLGGRTTQPVIVLFQGEWHSPNVGTFAQLALTIDGVFQSGAGFPVVDDRPSGEPDAVETHGFNWISQPLAPAHAQPRSSGGTTALTRIASASAA